MSEEPKTQQGEAEALERPRVTALDDILGTAIPVLNDGFVRVVDYMGSDESIVQAARVSYGKGTKATSEDRNLIRYLMRHRHTTPFEMCEIKFHVRVPMDCWRQWIRHRTASVNEYSTRYSIAIDEAQQTPPGEWRVQSKSSKQGSEGFLDDATGAALTKEETELQAHLRSVYEARIEKGVAREQARKDLPLSTYTEAYWKVDLHNLLHFLALRMDMHAQQEIRDYANAMGEIVSKWCPFAWEAFQDYRMSSMGLTGLEIPILEAIVANDGEKASTLAGEYGWLKLGKSGKLVRNRERNEFEEKLSRLGFAAPWR